MFLDTTSLEKSPNQSTVQQERNYISYNKVEWKQKSQQKTFVHLEFLHKILEFSSDIR